MRSVNSQDLAVCLALSTASLSLGYWIGASRTTAKITLESTTAQKIIKTSDGTPEAMVQEAEDESGSESEEDERADGDLGSITPGLFEECKLILVVRSDLGMTKGKIAAQCGHATLACYKALAKTNPALLKHWERTGQAKIAVRCDSEEEIMLLQATAQSLNICARTIRDAGRTQIAAGSQTVLGVGPAPVKLINQVTGKLKLL